MDHGDIITARHLKARGGQPGFVVIETVRNNPRVSFLFTADEALDFAEQMTLLAHGATLALTRPEGTDS